jgi:phenylpyruvate tautomerase PptA (4-oxalocrotonate tautomerase family)
VPIAQIHLTACTPAQRRRLLLEGSERYAAVLEAPLTRIRLFVQQYPAEAVAVAGRVVADSGQHAPFFHALIFRGRPVSVRHRLIAELTDLIVDVLEVDRILVRGLVTEVDPDGWGIGGVPASIVRRDEIAAREGARTVRGRQGAHRGVEL